ncbi:MAG TPA: nucleotidyltransferase family protein, partial [Myxococcales bacterium]
EGWLRPTSDVDLLVRPQDLERATAALRQAGYREFQGPAESAFDFHHHCSFAGPSKELVEVHFTPACGFQSRFDVESIFERSTEVGIEGGAPLPVLGLEDALVHMCAHAAHHRFEGVKWLFDLKLLVLTKKVDWPLAIRLAREARVAAAAGMALAEAARRVRAPIPHEVLQALTPGAPRRLLARRASQIPGVGIYPLSLVLADRVTVRWAKELAARPIERAARWAGKEKEFRALVRSVLGLEERW